MALNDVSDARIEASDVTAGGFDTDLSSDEVKEHIATADTIVSERLEGEDMTDDRLDRIELYLTRHLIRIGPDRQLQDDSMGPSSKNYQGDLSKEGLRSTTPGQQALMLDESGNLIHQEEFDQFYAI